MNKAKLILLGCPAVLAFMLLLTNTAQATEVVVQPTKTVESASATPIFEVEFVAQTPETPTSELTKDDAITSNDCGCSGETPTLEFTDRESDAAIERYGCDCAGCINSVRQLQGRLPLL